MSEFYRLLLGLHAWARRLDRDQALLGALGVAAKPYPHQLDSVHRMLTAPSCRWLLADEVGLGKTVQAIMVMRALAAQSAGPFKVVLVVPDDLVGQWQEELLTRGHAVAIGVGDDGTQSGNLVLRAARPSQLPPREELARNDLLIIDEFPKMAAHVRTELVAAAQTIPNVLVLTATPALHRAENRRELLALLEPEADRIAATMVSNAEDRDILRVLSERESNAADRFAEDLRDAGRKRLVADTFGLYRRIIRTERIDYPDVLPRRAYGPIPSLAPTDGDVDRARAARSYVEAARREDVKIDRNLLLQRAGRSADSLRDRLSVLPGNSTALAEARQQIEVSLREKGDAKLDALIDHIRSVHTKDPDARMVVVAEDNPTSDYLAKAIEKLAGVKVAAKRRVLTPAQNLAGQVAILRQALVDFISGEAKVLVAADIAKEGHNLQFANEIVFFALPWSPNDIQQWIGRIDRLGAKGIPGNRTIAITPIVTTGSTEESILAVLRDSGVFHRSEVFDESDWEAITNAIEAAAHGGGAGAWTVAAREARSLGETAEAWLRASRLPPTPRTELALRCHERLARRAYPLPVGAFEGSDWFTERELAVGSMIQFAGKVHLDIRKKKMGDQRFRTAWYKEDPRTHSFRVSELDDRGPWHRQAFIDRRNAIESPPRTHVVEDDDQNQRVRPLHFLDHGSPLHDSMIAAFEQQIPPTGPSPLFSVAYPAGHPALRWAGRKVLIGVAELDLRAAMRLDLETILGTLDPSASQFEKEARARAERAALAEFHADRRWMIGLAPPELLLAIFAEEGGPLALADEAHVVLYPFLEQASARQQGGIQPGPAVPAALTNRLRELTDQAARRAIEAVKRATATRRFSIEAEAENLVAAAHAESAKADATTGGLAEVLQARRRGAVLTRRLSERLRQARLARLEGLVDGMRPLATPARMRAFWVVPRPATDHLQ